MKKAALLSVSDRTGLVAFAKKLKQAGYILLGTSGTSKFLEQEGVEVLRIEEYIAQPEILDGRVKTLHPKIHAGLLARRDDPEHMRELEEHEIYPIEIAIVNLYPFVDNLKTDKVDDPMQMVELVDIGGPTMIRAAAKNFHSVYPVIDPADYDLVWESVASNSEVSADDKLRLRHKLATKVFAALADYNLQIAKYFSNVAILEAEPKISCSVDKAANFNFGGFTGEVLSQQQTLRYGENPHQQAAFYRPLAGLTKNWEQLNGKELSYNNILDFNAALQIVSGLQTAHPTAVIVKHLNPCGVAVSDTLVNALAGAKRGDTRSHFGGIIGLNQTVTLEVAEALCSDFAEIILAPAFDEDALARLKKKKNLRVIRVDLVQAREFESRSAGGGVLIQQLDSGVSEISSCEVVSQKKPSKTELVDLQLAWTLCAHVKSNAIALVKEGMLLAVGAGQMSRIDSAELAISKADTHGHELAGAVAASDAFFPFPDCIELLAQRGVTTFIAPGGAKRDNEVIEMADKAGVSLLFAGDRHFRH
ncbi:bifunctional phosphoribosylaminoimidazolecarboxamide formyltransferase/IMP cyclohydrolase [Oligoflexia bacterium]|nr:bifunctional phosphoribosylaminoimidazolecarboxamide formyltransferase/IMP cyclohydrolase [Oligoflexia bacterium]